MLQREMFLHSIENFKLKNARLREKMTIEGIDHSSIVKTPTVISTMALNLKMDSSSSDERNVVFYWFPNFLNLNFTFFHILVYLHSVPKM